MYVHLYTPHVCVHIHVLASHEHVLVCICEELYDRVKVFSNKKLKQIIVHVNKLHVYNMHI